MKLLRFLAACTAVAAIAMPIRDAQVARADIPLLTVDPGDAQGTISKYVYGANYGPWSLIPPDMTPLAEESGVTFLRFPGGEWGDENDLTPFHIDLYMTLAQTMDAEPFIAVRMKGGTPEKAAEVVRYVNVEKGYGVTYWSIGNEPDLFGDADNVYSADEHAVTWRLFAEAMLKVDPSIKLIGPDVSQYPSTRLGNAYANVRRDFVCTFLKANGDLVSAVSIHRYPFPIGLDSGSPKLTDLYGSTTEWDTMIPDLREVIRKTVGRDLPVAVMEVNSNWTRDTGGVASADSYANAIWWADVLGRMIRQKVEYVAYFALVTANEPYGMLARYAPRPTYYTYQLYKRFGSELIGSASPLDTVSITAAKRADGTITVMIVNRNEVDRAIVLQIADFTGELKEVYRLDPLNKASRIEDAVSPDGSFVLPGQSATLLVYG